MKELSTRRRSDNDSRAGENGAQPAGKAGAGGQEYRPRDGLDGQECPSYADGDGAEGARCNDAASLRRFLAAQIAAHLRVEPDQIDGGAPLGDFGLDSIVLFSLTGELAERLGRDLTATLLWDYPTIDSLAEHLAGPAAAEDISA